MRHVQVNVFEHRLLDLLMQSVVTVTPEEKANCHKQDKACYLMTKLPQVYRNSKVSHSHVLPSFHGDLFGGNTSYDHFK